MFSKWDVNEFLVSLFDKPATGSIYNGTDQNLVVLVFRLLNFAISKWMWQSSNWTLGRAILVWNHTSVSTAWSFDFEIKRMISDEITLHSVQLPLFIVWLGTLTTMSLAESLIVKLSTAFNSCKLIQVIGWKLEGLKIFTIRDIWKFFEIVF